MSNSDARGPPRANAATASLYAPDGRRKYLNLAERRRILAAADAAQESEALFVETMAWTGARISEVLAMTPASLQIERGVVAIVTLKRRCFVVREVPLPPQLVADLERHFQLSARQLDPELASKRLWRCHRVTAWRLVKSLMRQSGISGPSACPRGFRHGFGVGTLQAGVPLNLVQRWLGHARISTTAIYAGACGDEERAIAERFWNK